MRIGLLVLALVVVAAAASGQAGALTTAVDTSVVTGSTILIEEQSFAIHISSTANEIAADYGKGTLFISNNSCDSTALAKICLDNIEYDYTSKVYKAKVRGISLAPVMSVTREASKSEFQLGDATKFTVTLENTGGLARNITYEDVFPAEFEVIDGDGPVAIRPDRAVWKGKLDEGKSVAFSYRAKAMEVFDGSLVSSLTYSDGLKLKTVYSSKASLKTSFPVELVSWLGDKEVIVGEPDNVTANVTVKLNEDALVTVEMAFDQGLKVTSKPYAMSKLSPSAYVWKGEVARVTNRSTNASNQTGWLNQTKTFFFEFKGQRVGSSDVTVKVSYAPKSTGVYRNLPVGKQSVSVTNKGIAVRTSLADATIESNQGNRAKVWLQNLNPYAKLKDATVNLSTDMIYLPNSYLREIGTGEQVLIADKFFYAPKTDKSKSYVLYTNVSYLTEFGDNFSKEFKDTISVVPTQSVDLAQTVSNANLKGDEEAEVSVSVKNSRPTTLRNVIVADNVSPEFTVIGKNVATLQARSKESVKAYTYKLKAPRTSREIVLYVNSTLKYSDAYNSDEYFEPNSYEVSKVTPITVAQESFPLTVARTVDDSTIYAGEFFDVKYLITNTAKDKVARNIVLRTPLAYEVDLVGGSETRLIPQLNPGEAITVSNWERRRAKFSGDFSLQKPTLTYENIYGDGFSANGSATTVSVKENYVTGPVILAEKIAPKSANDTDSFLVQLKLRNVGTEAASVLVSDENASYNVLVKAGEEQLINQAVKRTIPGIFALPMATASYDVNGSRLTAATKSVEIEIVNNPVIRIEKVAPSFSSSIEPYAVLVKVRNLAAAAVRNVSIEDSGVVWEIGAIPAGGTANVSYEETRGVGTHSLGSASATYLYENAIYTVKSNSPAIAIEEKRHIDITKEIAPKSAGKGKKVTVLLGAINKHTSSISIKVLDSVKNFEAELAAGEQRNFTYETNADVRVSAPANVTYELDGRLLSAQSGAPDFALVEEEASDESREGDAAEGREGGLARFFASFKRILTWKRGG
ncbi:DUF11 domain-containing protein [Candidatus Woesearchaeota archaeon]|nr:DUF11 domain-containing protein [Candidatus Woesearchaeota archaeon]